jgi:hypothetical protein
MSIYFLRQFVCHWQESTSRKTHPPGRFGSSATVIRGAASALLSSNPAKNPKKNPDSRETIGVNGKCPSECHRENDSLPAWEVKIPKQIIRKATGSLG